MSSALEPLTRVSLERAPDVCQDCVFWQSHGFKRPSKERWAQHLEDDWGPWGTLYYDSGGRLLGFMQCGPAGHFPRSAELPAGPPSADALLITCVYITDESTPWVVQSLFLAVIGEAHDRGVKAIETFAYQEADDASPRAGFQPHRTIFPAAFVGDFGFRSVRTEGRVELVRLEIAGLTPLPVEGWRRRLVRRVFERASPAPVPERP